MQEIKKRRIVLASLLKPVDDSRMSEKLGATLSDHYEVIVIGQPSQAAMLNNHLLARPLPRFDRISFKRIMAPFYAMRTILNVRPSVLIVCAAELLPISLLTRLFQPVHIIYDVQENYALNLLHGSAWPRMLRPLLAWAVRLVERIASPVITHFLLAEKSYADELGFVQGKFTVVENKSLRPGRPYVQDTTRHVPGNFSTDIRLLFSGTLADTSGVFLAIELAKQLHSVHTGVKLKIVGFAAKPEVRLRLEHLATEHSFITLEGIDHLVPHNDILQAIDWAHFGIISYPENQSTWSSHPTKLFEYLGRLLPILLIDNPRWVRQCEPYNAAVVFNPSRIVANDLLSKMKSDVFYTEQPTDVFWDGEASKLLRVVRDVIT